MVFGEGGACGLSPFMRQLTELKARPSVRTFWKAAPAALRVGQSRSSILTGLNALGSSGLRISVSAMVWVVSSNRAKA